MPVAEASLRALVPSQFTKNDPRRHTKQKGEISHINRLRMAERIARKLDPTKKPFDVHLMSTAYEKTNVMIAVANKLYPNATPEKEAESEVAVNKVEVYIEFGKSTNIQDQAQRPSSEGNFIDLEASAMST